MPRFFFQTEDGGVFRDEDGVNLPGLAEARRQAARMLGEMLKEQPDKFWADGCLKLTIADERGLVLFAVEASATLAPAAGLRPGGV